MKINHLVTFGSFLLATASLAQIESAPTSGASLTSSSAFVCTDENQKPFVSISAPNSKGTRILEFIGSSTDSSPVSLEFCADNTAANDPFGVEGGSLGCFDSQFNPQYKVLIVLSRGFDGETGDFLMTNPRTFEVIGRGSCQSPF